MAEPRFANDDDLPLTFRRAREERERELREREVEAAGPTLGTAPVAANDEDDVPLPPRAFRPAAVAEAPTGVVRRIEIPFLHLVAFFLKAVVAAIPALILLAGLLWLGGKGLQTFLPDLGRMQIFIKFGT
jgi:hypothetical protein